MQKTQKILAAEKISSKLSHDECWSGREQLDECWAQARKAWRKKKNVDNMNEEKVQTTAREKKTLRPDGRKKRRRKRPQMPIIILPGEKVPSCILSSLRENSHSCDTAETPFRKVRSSYR
jgi:hypothetical protein